MSEEIIKILDELCKRFGITIDWTSENLLPYAEELAKKFVNYELTMNIVYSIIWILVITGLVIVSVKTYRTAKKDEFYANAPSFSFMVISFLVTETVGFVFLLFSTDYITNIVTCLTFPEKAIFEYVSTFM